MYRFYLANMLLPVTPSKLSVKTKNMNKTVTLINEGEVNIIKTKGLRGLSGNDSHKKGWCGSK